MLAPEENSFVLPRVTAFPKTKLTTKHRDWRETKLTISR